MKAKLALLEVNPSTSQTLKTFQPKNKGLVTETFNSDEEKVSDDKKVTQVKVLMALADDELTVGKNHARNDEWIDITMRNIMLSRTTEKKKINEKWLTGPKKVSQCISEQIPHQKKKVLSGELVTESSSKINENENLFVPASMCYHHEMVPKSKDGVERFNPDSKLSNFNTRRILVIESQAINESFNPTETSINLESSKDSKAKSLIPLPLLKNLHGALPS
nr:retrovirus-related Pol polyprotein from transposon TNT 1-94 [Tanacetum cinerariifolium]